MSPSQNRSGGPRLPPPPLPLRKNGHHSEGPSSNSGHPARVRTGNPKPMTSQMPKQDLKPQTHDALARIPGPHNTPSSDLEPSVWDDNMIERFKKCEITLEGILSQLRYHQLVRIRRPQSPAAWEKLYSRNTAIISTTIFRSDPKSSSYMEDLERALRYQLPVVKRGKNLDYKDTEVNGIPSIFYAVYSRDLGKVKLWLNNGGDANSVAKSVKIFQHRDSLLTVDLPLLAFAILLGEPDIVRLLLSFGARSSTIPDVLRKPVLKPAIEELKSPELVREEFTNNVSTNETTKWCNAVVFSHLREALNLTMRYDLQRADSFKVTDRQKQFAQSRGWNILPLFRAHFDLIGQEYALKKLFKHVITISSTNTRYPTKPTVFLFAGPSGHGKTELASKMKEYLGLEFHSVDMAKVQRETELFGASQGYAGYEHGSSLNNFLADNNGRRCVVFLDEIEKTPSRIRNSLLKSFDKGASTTDRRSENVTIDISKVIWIMATNTLDRTIQSFYNQHKPLTLEKLLTERGRLERDLEKAMKIKLHKAFGDPFTGRIDLILPFFPFSPEEQVALAHRFLCDLRMDLAQPLCLEDDPQELMGNIKLTWEDDLSVSEAITESYIPEEGARSIRGGVERLRTDLTNTVIESSDEPITNEDLNKIVEYVLTVDNDNKIAIRPGDVTARTVV